jgi:hypothetical protein
MSTMVQVNFSPPVCGYIRLRQSPRSIVTVLIETCRKRKRGTGQIDGESEGKRGWSGHHGRKPSSSEVGEGFQGGNRERNERATFDPSFKRLRDRLEIKRGREIGRSRRTFDLSPNAILASPPPLYAALRSVFQLQL